MDISMTKSSAQDQMEIMTMMMQLGMDKLPQYSGHNCQDIYELQEMEFSGGSSSSIECTPSALHCSFIDSSFQEPMNQFLAPTFPFPHPKSPSDQHHQLQKTNSVETMREMMFQIAAMQPIQIDPESVKPPQRRNVKISKDPQSIAARHRRERISEKIRILQRLVPGGTKMDTASMLDEAVHYMKFLKKQVQSLELRAAGSNRPMGAVGYQGTMAAAAAVNMNYSSLARACQPAAAHRVGSMQMLS